ARALGKARRRPARHLDRRRGHAPIAARGPGACRYRAGDAEHAGPGGDGRDRLVRDHRGRRRAAGPREGDPRCAGRRDRGRRREPGGHGDRALGDRAHLRVSPHGGARRRGRAPRILAPRGGGARPADRRGIRALRAQERTPSRGAPQHGHLSWRHERGGDLPAREGRAADGTLEGRVRRLPADPRAWNGGRRASRGAPVRNAVTAIVIALACAGGLWLASVDARTDDTGVEAGLIFLIAAALSAVRPRAAVIIAMIVGAPIPISEALQGGGIPGGIAALGFAGAGALAGAYLGIVARRGLQPSS